MSQPPPQNCIDIYQVADLIGVCPDTIRAWIKRGTFLRPLRFGRLLLWHRATLENWLRQQQEAAHAQA